MFPLGSVLVPTMLLPLHVFEPRYRVLVHDLLAGDREFGVALIERGSEVGGGDVRTDVGCVAQVVEAREFPDGRWMLGCVGTRRIRVVRWLDDDPYPRAEVQDWPEPAATDAELAELNSSVQSHLRRLLALQAELGVPTPPLDIELATDPVLASHQMSALAPVGSFDRYRLLGAVDAQARLELLAALLGDAEQLLHARLDDAN